MMFQRFLQHISSEQLFVPSDTLLLAVSGGKDSMAMLHLFVKAKVNFAVAHCNFQLRDNAANEDEKFVRETCQQHQIPFHSIRFDTTNYAQTNKLSTQMAARELRYQWFETLLKENNYQVVATAHHKNDVAETMLINLVKGTGISGLHGIKAKNNKIIRPMLCFTSEEIQAFVEQEKIAFREDESNASVKYVRNKIRHQIIPELTTINPNLIETLYRSSIVFSETETILQQKIEEEKNKCVSNHHNGIKINIAVLLHLQPIHSYLFYFLQAFSFNIDDCRQIAAALSAEPGKVFYSPTHQLVKDRDYLFISVIQKQQTEEYTITNLEDFSILPTQISVQRIENTAVRFKKNKQFAYLDEDQLTFPLRLRKWREGDFFIPFGMKGKKKVSDFFIDEKYSILQKEAAWLLTDQKDNIVWIVNARIDQRYSVTEKTKTILVLNTL